MPNENRVTKKRSTHRRRPVPPITSNFWPAVKEALNINAEQANNIDIPCLSCRGTLKPGEKQNDFDCFGITMMACGHFMGKECIKEMMATDTYQFKCPQCFKDLYHSQCRHHTQVAPIEDFNNVKENLKAKVLGGGEGGFIPPRCVQCCKGPVLAKLTGDIYERLTNREITTIGNTLVYSIWDSWGYLFHHRANIDVSRPVDQRVRVVRWDEDKELENVYCHDMILNAKCRSDLDGYLSYGAGAWGPGWINTYVGLPDRQQAEVARGIFNTALPTLPDVSISEEVRSV